MEDTEVNKAEAQLSTANHEAPWELPERLGAGIKLTKSMRERRKKQRKWVLASEKSNTMIGRVSARVEEHDNNSL